MCVCKLIKKRNKNGHQHRDKLSEPLTPRPLRPNAPDRSIGIKSSAATGCNSQRQWTPSNCSPAGHLRAIAAACMTREARAFGNTSSPCGTEVVAIVAIAFASGATISFVEVTSRVLPAFMRLSTRTVRRSAPSGVVRPSPPRIFSACLARMTRWKIVAYSRACSCSTATPASSRRR